MSLHSENVRGWIGTVVFHILIVIILFLWKLDLSVSQQEYVEVTWGSVSNISTSTPSRPSVSGFEGSASTPVLRKSNSMNLPERRFSTDDEVLRLPPPTKIAADEQPVRVKTLVAVNSKGTKDRGIGAGTGKKEKFTSPSIGESISDVAGPLGSGISGSDVGKSVSVSMLWSDGGTRKKISGALPEYPEGVRVESQIKIELTVQPDGGVKLLRPEQKGNMKLEEAAIRETRLWKFERLRKSSPQRDQTCLVTFNFQLR